MSHHPQKAFRPEIQGLRAWAVLLVMVFHLWPSALPGGFIGVDVFFVISGYLITRLLMDEAEQSRTISLTGFYARRIRRLLPAATLVLLVVTAFLPMIPRAQWEQNAMHLIASTLYVENWWLAWQAVDYFGAEEAPSVVQHYWSLAVEEQFYLLWPILMLGLCQLAWKRNFAARKAVLLGLAVLTLGSFGCSVWLTEAHPQNAYFFTHVRLWELGAGGLLAVSQIAIASTVLRKLLVALGMVLLVGSAFLVAHDGFPGWVALAPVSAAVLLILSRAEGAAGFVLLRTRPVQFLGDISYSLYLWHWPLIVWWQAQVGEVDISAGVALFVGAVVLATLTRRYVEEYVLYGRMRWSWPREHVYRFGAVMMVACILSAGGIWTYIHSYVYYTADQRMNPVEYPGAAALLLRAPVQSGVEPLPSLLHVRQDKPDLYRKDCHVGYEDHVPVACEYGNRNARKHVVLVGDSHAAQWVPALDALAQKYDWRLTVFTKSACPLLNARVGEKEAYENCYLWGQQVIGWLKSNKPALFIQTEERISLVYAPALPLEKRQLATRDAILSLWDELEREGINVLALRDVPILDEDPTTCLSKQKHCSFDREKALGYDPLYEAALEDPTIPFIDMTDGICGKEKCDAVVGNVVVWRDYGHLTVTYVNTLAPTLGQRLQTLLTAWDGTGGVGGYTQ